MGAERSGALAAVLAGETPERLLKLASLLDSGRLEVPARRPRIEREFGGSDDAVSRVVALLSQWESVGAGPLAEVLVAAAGAERAEPDSAELVWTGPDGGNPTARRTGPVLHELLRWASHRVTIVGYSLFLGGPAIGDLLGRLGELSTNGVLVEFIVDRRYAGWGSSGPDGHSIRQIHQHWPKGRRRPTIWSWASDDDESAKLHAKVVIVDRRDLLVTSANLTGSGLEANLELGVRLRGDVAADCADHFDRLVSHGFFHSEPWEDE